MIRSLLLAAPLVLGACATAKPVYNPVMPFDAESAKVSAFSVASDVVPEKAVGLDTPVDYGQINTIAMNQMYANPAISPAAGAAGGLIAGLIIAGIDAAVDSARNAKINEFLVAQGFDAKAVFFDALKSELGEDGYTLVMADAKAAAPAAPGTKLEIKLDHYGYQISMKGWAPTASASVSIIAADGKTVLLRDFVALGSPPVYVPTSAPGLGALGGDAVILPYDPAYLFKDVDAIVKGDPKEGVAAEKFALRSIARGVARLVRHAVPAPAPVQAAQLQPAQSQPVSGSAQ